MEYSFNLYNQLAPTGLTMSLKNFLKDEVRAPVVLCIGSDLVIGDSLGPVTGTLIQNKTHGVACYVYGNLTAPVTAKEVKYVDTFLRRTHPGRKIIAVDAAIGEEGDVGLIKISDRALKPGSGAKKKLGKVGDISILGVVAEKSLFNYAVLGNIRFNIVYKMSDIISEAIASYFWS